MPFPIWLHFMSIHTPPHTPPLDCTRCLGQSKPQTKTVTIKTIMAHTPRLAPLRNDDPLRGQSYPPPLRFFLSEILAPRPGQIYATVNADNTHLSPMHLLRVHRPGLSYPTTSIQPHRTAKMPNDGSRLSPGIFRMEFLFDFIYSLIITHNNNPDLCPLLYPAISPYLSPLPFCLFSVSGPVVCGHTQKRT